MNSFINVGFSLSFYQNTHHLCSWVCLPLLGTHLSFCLIFSFFVFLSKYTGNHSGSWGCFSLHIWDTFVFFVCVFFVLLQKYTGDHLGSWGGLPLLGAQPLWEQLSCLGQRSPPPQVAHTWHLLTLFFLWEMPATYIILAERMKHFVWSYLKQICSIPAGIFGIYFYNMFLSLIGSCMGDHPKKNLGFILLLQYILFDCLKLFVSFLLGEHLLRIMSKKSQSNQKTCRHRYDQLCPAFFTARAHWSHDEEHNQGGDHI